MFCQQVKFWDTDGGKFGGILVNDEYIICGCCGGVFEKSEVIYEIFDNWVDIDEAIRGD